MVGDVPQSVSEQWVANPDGLRVESWVENLEAPWGLAFLPDNRALVTERPGRVRLIEEGRLRQEPYFTVDAANTGEGGLMGIALHPDFPEEPYVYVMYTYRRGGLVNKVERYRHEGDTARFDQVILDDIPGARFHNGGRIAFGPDGMLYITAGENFRAERAQDRSTVAGSILRVAPDGSIPADNPFEGSPIYSYGHRNPQGLAWHPQTGELFSSEHGPSREFGLHGYDMVNVVVKGENYGWPRAVGEVNRPEYQDPLVMWEEPVPPAGLAFWEGDLYLATLGSRALIRIGLSRSSQAGDGDTGSSAGDGGAPQDPANAADRYRVESIERLFATGPFEGRYGRLRAAVVGPDGALYVTTSNRDGRGSPRDGDDRILRITPRR
jgi:quinoprotein glucose dehydrogenase